jgi:hypothetical protein
MGCIWCVHVRIHQASQQQFGTCLRCSAHAPSCQQLVLAVAAGRVFIIDGFAAVQVVTRERMRHISWSRSSIRDSGSSSCSASSNSGNVGAGRLTPRKVRERN